MGSCPLSRFQFQEFLSEAGVGTIVCVTDAWPMPMHDLLYGQWCSLVVQHLFYFLSPCNGFNNGNAVDGEHFVVSAGTRFHSGVGSAAFVFCVKGKSPVDCGIIR